MSFDDFGGSLIREIKMKCVLNLKKKKNVIHTRQCEEDNGSMLISQKIRQYHKLKDNIHFSKVVFECNK